MHFLFISAIYWERTSGCSSLLTVYYVPRSISVIEPFNSESLRGNSETDKYNISWMYVKLTCDTNHNFIVGVTQKWIGGARLPVLLWAQQR